MEDASSVAPSNMAAVVSLAARSESVVGPEQPADDFQSKVQKFMSENAAMFEALAKQQNGKGVPKTPTLHNSQGETTYKYSEPEALEFQMRVDPYVRERRLFELVKLGDIMEGHVISKEFRELAVRITSFAGSHKFREMSDINIHGRVSYENLSKESKEKEKVFEEMQLKDVIQGVVIGRHGDLLNLSFRESHVTQFCENGKLPLSVHLGYQSGKVPPGGKQWRGRSDDFLRRLEDDSGFSNPSCVDNLKVILGIRSEISGMESLGPGMRPTLFSDLQMVEFPSCDYHRELRKVQRAKWSMDTVAAGVKSFKSGEHSKAMKMLDHALDIDPDNVEGLVARGALYANGGHFRDGIRDFEKALTLKHTHCNAKKYLVETQMAYGEDLEKKGHVEEALRCYKEALADDPDRTVARERLSILTAIVEKQAAERREKEQKKAENEKTLRKIKKFLDKEREKKKSKKATKKEKRKKKQKRGTYKSTAKRSRKDSHSSRRYTSSESDTTYSDATSESSRSRSRSRSHCCSPYSDRRRSSSRSPYSDRHGSHRRDRYRSPSSQSRRHRRSSYSDTESNNSPSHKRRLTTDSHLSPSHRRKASSSKKKTWSPSSKKKEGPQSSPQRKLSSRSGYQSSRDSNSPNRAKSHYSSKSRSKGGEQGRKKRHMYS